MSDFGLSSLKLVINFLISTSVMAVRCDVSSMRNLSIPRAAIMEVKMPKFLNDECRERQAFLLLADSNRKSTPHCEHKGNGNPIPVTQAPTAAKSSWTPLSRVVLSHLGTVWPRDRTRGQQGWIMASDYMQTMKENQWVCLTVSL